MLGTDQIEIQDQWRCAARVHENSKTSDRLFCNSMRKFSSHIPFAFPKAVGDVGRN